MIVLDWNSAIPERHVSQHFYGIAWYRYYGPVGHSFFTSSALGLSSINAYHYDGYGPGLLVGGGYEFGRHFQVEGCITGGRILTSNFDSNVIHLGVVLTAILY